MRIWRRLRSAMALYSSPAIATSLGSRGYAGKIQYGVSASSPHGDTSRVAVAPLLFFQNRRHVGLDHVAHQALERRLVMPAQPGTRLGGIAQEVVHFGRPEIAGVDFDQYFAGR